MKARAIVWTLFVLQACADDSRDDALGGAGGLPPLNDDEGEAGGAGDDGDGDGDGATDEAGAGGGDQKFDLGGFGDVPSDCNDLGEDFSYIWIANSGEDTVSKIDTRTGVEVGRFNTGGGSPSRTSVNLLGDVAVSSRDPAGVVKLAARESDCIDVDGDGVVRTSTGPHDVLPWTQDECVLWHIEVPSSGYYSGPRPTAWEGGHDPDPSDCDVPTPRLWIGFKDPAGAGVFWRLDGDDGSLLDEVVVPDWGGAAPLGPVGPYGGAVNAQGDLWVIGINDGQLLHIDGETLQVTAKGNPGLGLYGIGLDASGNPWLTGYFSEGTVVHDVSTGTFTSIGEVGGKQRGLQVDRQGRAWAAGNLPCRLVEYDVTSRAVTHAEIILPDCKSPVGVSIDVDGFVWVVDKGADMAFKVDPDSHAVALTVGGLNAPYTYSDMTGAGLDLVVHPPG